VDPLDVVRFGGVLGMVIGTAIGLSNGLTMAVSIVLALLFGYAFTIFPLLRSGMPLRNGGRRHCNGVRLARRNGRGARRRSGLDLARRIGGVGGGRRIPGEPLADIAGTRPRLGRRPPPALESCRFSESLGLPLHSVARAIGDAACAGCPLPPKSRRSPAHQSERARQIRI
jgi:hypothetical protein